MNYKLWPQKIVFFVLAVQLMLGLSGCYYWLRLPSFPMPPPTAPKISNLSLSPAQVPANARTPVTVSFQYEDLDGDVDTNSNVELSFSSSFGSTGQLFGSADQVNRDTEVISGRVSEVFNTDTTGVFQEGTISVTVTLIDKAGNRSNSLQGTLRVVGTQSGGGGYPPLGDHCEIWFVDQPEGRRVDGYHIGDTIFLMVYDPTLGVTNPQALFAEIANVSLLVPPWPFMALLTMTSQPYIYASRIGPRVGVTHPAVIGDTIAVAYTAMNDPSDFCLAQAKIVSRGR
jgi:hypothetical protein